MQILSGDHWKIHVADVMEGLAAIPSGSVHCVVTSPPYWGLRDYGYEGQIGMEATPDLFVQSLTQVFAEVGRTMRDDGLLFVNLGDSYATGAGAAKNPVSAANASAFPNCQPNRMNFGLSAGNMVGAPWRFAFAMQADGWILRSEIIWAKPSPMPESVSGVRFKDGEISRGSWRPTKSHESIFMFAKTSRYFADGDGSKEPAVGGTPGNIAPVKVQNPEDGQKELGRTTSRWRNNMTKYGAVETRNMRSVWRISSESYKEAHFATFPTEIPRRCISAATSRGGCCSGCGEQFAPIVDTERRATRPGHNSKVNRVSRHLESPYQDHAGSICGNRDPHRHTTIVNVSGYLPTCRCQAAAGRPIVLDPFGGSMTTGQVAINMGCDFIGCEANPEYAALGVKRLETPWIPVSERKKATKKRRKKVARQQELFTRE